MFYVIFDSESRLLYGGTSLENSGTIHVHEFRNGEGESYDIPQFDIHVLPYEEGDPTSGYHEVVDHYDNCAENDGVRLVVLRTPTQVTVEHKFSRNSTHAHLHEFDLDDQTRCLSINLETGEVEDVVS